MGLNIKQEAVVDVATPTTARTYLFFDVADEILKKKLSDGTVVPIEAGATGVTSVFGRLGNVTAQTGDYSASQITNFDTAADARITIQKGAANGLATLDASGLIPEAQLPPIAKTEIFSVGDQASMLALPAQPGDIAIRTDQKKCYALQTSPPTVLSNWKYLEDAVQTVNGQAGVVVLTYSDVGATPISHVGAGGSQHAQVTPSVDGFMSAADKTKLDGISPGSTAGITELSGDVVAVGPGVVPVTLSDTVINSKLLTGYTPTLGVVTATDSIVGSIGEMALTQTLAPRTVSQTVVVPDGYVWVRPSLRLTGSLRMLGDSELRLI